VKVLAIVHQSDAGPGVFAEAIEEFGAELDQWLLPEQPRPPADPLGYDAVFTLGGSMNVDQGDRHPWLASESELLKELLREGVPLMGLCLGGQMVAEAAGALPGRAPRPEIGWPPVSVTEAGAVDPVFGPLAPRFKAFSWHSYEFPLPPGAIELARSELCLQACRIGEAAWALQFHPEVSAADAFGWIDGYEADEDAVRIGLDDAAFRFETEARIAAFNQLGRDICRRWLEFAAARQPQG
jgi:GMP synthase (glutamine-hydrolysing)